MEDETNSLVVGTGLDDREKKAIRLMVLAGISAEVIQSARSNPQEPHSTYQLSLKKPDITDSDVLPQTREIREWNRIVDQRKKDKKERKITKDKSYVIVKGRRTGLSSANLRQVQGKDT
jgi:hypothetical protein